MNHPPAPAPGFYVHDTALAALEGAEGPLDVSQQSHLAWHLRERDTPRAVTLAQAVLSEAATQPLHGPAPVARAHLTLGECARLHGQLDRAAEHLQTVEATLPQHGHAADHADAHWVRALLMSAQGELAASSAHFVMAIEHARLAQDPTRSWVLEAALARHTGMTDRLAAQARWERVMAHSTDTLSPAAAAAVGLYTGYVAFRASDFGGAIQHFTRQLEPLRQHGFRREAIIAAVNTSGAFLQLNDTEGALTWIEQALEWAQASGWPATHGGCLAQLGELLHRRGELTAAQQVLTRSQAVFSAHPTSRNYVVVTQSLAEVNLDLQQPQLALASFDRMLTDTPYPDLALIARLGRARALQKMADWDAATASADETIAEAQAQGATAVQIDALQVLAELATHKGQGPEAALVHLRAAEQLAQATPGYKAHAGLLDALAQAHASAGAFEAAYRASQEAAAARAVMHRQEAANRHQAMQVHALLAAAETEALHLRELAEAERRKAALETQSAAILTRLGLIGQELTRHLDRPSIYASLAGHIPALLDASGFEIYLVSQEGLGLTSVFGLEHGERLPEDFIPMDDPVSNTARCAREQRELLVALAADGTDPTQVPGTMRTLSALFAPLKVGDRVLGVMTVQSPHAQAYGAHETQVFRSLCAYAAIALDNASAYQRLHDARSQLVSQEKLAALGALVAGVAHELNTPLGNSLLMASTLAQNAETQVQALQANAVRRKDLAQFLSDTASAAQLITQSLGTAAQLISNFKQVAVDRSAEQRRRFDLGQVSAQVVATMQVSVRQSGHKLSTDLPEGIEMDSLPGPYGQVLSNLITNAMLHGFGQRSGGHMHLSLRRLPEDRVEVRFRDDGAGIDPAHAQRIFEPFFTTKFGQGGSGLGLSISYNIVTSLLGGHIGLDRSVGSGTCFVITLPLTAPASAGEQAPEHFG